MTDTADVQVDLAVNGVLSDVKRLAEFAEKYPHLVQGQLQDIKIARNGLVWVVEYLDDWQETQKQIEPADLLGSG